MTAAMFRGKFGGKTVAPPRVLILDDDRFDRKRVARWLKEPHMGLVFLTEAADLIQFETALAKHRFDLVLIDYVLADGDGLDAMNYIANAPLNSNSYTVMISGFEDGAAGADAAKFGCDRFLPKSELTSAVLSNLISESSGRGFEQPWPFMHLEPLTAVDFWANRARRRSQVDAMRSEEGMMTKVTKAKKRDVLKKVSPDLVETPAAVFGTGLCGFTDTDFFDFTFDKLDF